MIDALFEKYTIYCLKKWICRVRQICLEFWGGEQHILFSTPVLRGGEVLHSSASTRALPAFWGDNGAHPFIYIFILCL